MRIHLRFIFLPLILFIISGCAGGRTRVVLLQDHDGNVGEVSLCNSHGTTILKRAGFAVTMKGEDSPELPYRVDSDEIREDFSVVFEVEPSLP